MLSLNRWLVRVFFLTGVRVMLRRGQWKSAALWAALGMALAVVLPDAVNPVVIVKRKIMVG